MQYRGTAPKKGTSMLAWLTENYAMAMGMLLVDYSTTREKGLPTRVVVVVVV